jgi:hypothetical protein
MRPCLSLSAILLPAMLAPHAAGAADAAFAKDLKATIALQGMPCDQIVGSKRNGDSDYNASCKDGNRYHIFVDPSGRVVVKKL